MLLVAGQSRPNPPGKGVVVNFVTTLAQSCVVLLGLT